MTHVWIGGFYLFYFAFIGVNVVFFPKLLYDFGYSSLDIGILFAILPLVRFLTPFVFSHYLAFTTQIFRYALIVTFLSSLAIVLSIHSFWSLFVSLFFWSIAFSIILPFVDAKALTLMDKTTYSKVRVAGSVGFMATTLLIGTLSSSSHFQLSLLLFTSLCIVITGWLLIGEDDHALDATSDAPQKITLTLHWQFWVSMFLMQVAFAGYYNFFTIFASDHNFLADQISYFWTLAVIAEIFMLFYQGSLFRFSLSSLIIVATFFTALRWFLIDFFPYNEFVIYLAQTFHSVGFALYHTATIALLFELYPNKRVAQQYYYGISFGLGGFLGALLFGTIYSESIFFVAALITLASGAMMIWHHHALKE